MLLADEQRRHVNVNAALLKLLGEHKDGARRPPVWEVVAGGPIFTDG